MRAPVLVLILATALAAVAFWFLSGDGREPQLSGPDDSAQQPLSPDGAGVFAPGAPPDSGERRPAGKPQDGDFDPDALDVLDDPDENALSDAIELETLDAAGISAAHRRETLEQFHDQLRETLNDESESELVKAQAEYSFLTRCVATILHADGRAIFPPAGEHSGKSIPKASHSGEYVFAYKGAFYKLLEGEFPTFDNARARMLALVGGKPAPERSAAFDQVVRSVYERALATF